ncbi:MAG: hypothetical protein FJX75_18035 [Armatimonadetes bacterium]|nr:hypothetical protein [Armatimonadota bacterium]
MLGIMVALLVNGGVARAEVPAEVPGYPDLRYIIHYRETSPEFLDFLQQSRTSFLHWHGPFSGYTGLPERERLAATMASAKAVVDAVHQRGARIIFYIGPCFSYGDLQQQTILFDFWQKRWDTYADYLGARPADLIDCTQRDAAGAPRPYEYEGQKGYHLCVNSPGVRQYTKGIIRLICEAGADGSFYDGPYVTQGSCYCHWCRERFRKWLAETYPEAVLRGMFGVSDTATVEAPKEASSPLWIAWREFGAWTLYDFMRETKEYARSLNPQYTMTSNYCMWMGEPYGPLRGTAEDIALWSKVVDIVFDEAEYGAGPRMQNAQKRSNSIDYRYLVAASHGKPVALLKTAPEGETPEAAANLTRLAIAEGAAHGATWQFHYLKGAAAQAAIEYNAFLAQHADELRGARPHANVGLVASVQQVYVDAASYPCAVSRELSDQHIDHRMLIDEDVEEASFEGLDALILPEVRMLTERQMEAVKTFVRDGGGAVLIGPCGNLDEWGRERGVSLVDQLLRPAEMRNEPATRATYGWGRVAYIPHVDLPSWANTGLTPKQHEGLAKLPELVEWAAGDLSLRVWAPASVEATAMYGPGNPPRSVYVHLVNYDVDLAGKVTDAPEIGLRVQMPDGMAPVNVRVQSPDAGAESWPSGWGIAWPGARAYVVVRVPRLHVYSRVKLWLAPMAQQPTEGSVRFSAPLSAPAGSLVRLRAEYGSEGQARGAYVYGTADWQPIAGEHHEVQGRVVTGQFHVPDATAGGSLLLLITQRPRNWQPCDYRFLRITPPLALSLAAPSRIARGMGPVAVSATIRNETDRAREVGLAFEAPPGWQVEKQGPSVDLGPGETRVVRCIVEPEATAAPGRYPLSARLTYAGGPGDTERVLAASATTEIVDKIPTAKCGRTHEPPRIDGKLDDACWKAAPSLDSLIDIDKRAPSKWPTTVRLLHDGANLYAAFECSESEPASILAQVREDGGEVWQDDSVELFLDPDGDLQRYEQFVANVLGARNRKSPEWQVRTSRNEAGWIVEMSIPLAGIGQPQPGDVWVFDACRTRPARPQAPLEHSSWAPTEGTFHQPAKWGLLVFEE